MNLPTAIFCFIGKCILNLRISLVSFISELFRVCVILADSDKIDLQLERTVAFICQSKSDSVDLENTRSCTSRGYSNVWCWFMPWCDVFTRPCPARAGADRPAPSHDWWGRTWRMVSGKQATAEERAFVHLVPQIYWTHLDLLPVGPASGVQEIAVNVVFLVREVGFGRDVDHPRTAIATHAQMQRVERGPVVVLFSVKGPLKDKGNVCWSLEHFITDSRVNSDRIFVIPLTVRTWLH